jgi:cell wall assembly regulator SMI1
MSTLTAGLERIMKWLEENQPEYAVSFLPGLQYEEIKLVEAEINFKLPKEIYELYQWRNGTQEDAKAICFPTINFLPISRSVKSSKGCNEYIEKYKKLVGEEGQWYETSPLFLFIENNGNYCGIPLVEYQEEKLVVVEIGEGEMARIFYASLTDMMLTLAECYETGAYYLNEHNFINEDKGKADRVFYKYNADLTASCRFIR